jgi:hypothetical protein
LRRRGDSPKTVAVTRIEDILMALSRDRAQRALDYLTHMDDVHGWLMPTTALGIVETLLFQEDTGVAGGLAEIGIHHGKSFLALAAAARQDEKLHAIDVFEQQEKNTDRSGWGDRDTFLAHVARFFPGVQPIVVAHSSADIAGHEAEFGLGGLRFLSIDGGHTAALTLNDLRIADACLGDAGACCLDDVFNPRWTGVVSGLFAFLATAPRLVPYAFLPNKLFLCRPGQVGQYRAHLRDVLAHALERTGQEFGAAEIDVYRERWPQLSASLRAFAGPAAPVPVAPPEPDPLARAAAAERAVAAIRASTSWRLTEPIRLAGRLLGRP